MRKTLLPAVVAATIIPFAVITTTASLSQRAPSRPNVSVAYEDTRDTASSPGICNGMKRAYSCPDLYRSVIPRVDEQRKKIVCAGMLFGNGGDADDMSVSSDSDKKHHDGLARLLATGALQPLRLPISARLCTGTQPRAFSPEFVLVASNETEELPHTVGRYEVLSVGREVLSGNTEAIQAWISEVSAKALSSYAMDEAVQCVTGYIATKKVGFYSCGHYSAQTTGDALQLLGIHDDPMNPQYKCVNRPDKARHTFGTHHEQQPKCLSFGGWTLEQIGCTKCPMICNMSTGYLGGITLPQNTQAYAYLVLIPGIADCSPAEYQQLNSSLPSGVMIDPARLFNADLSPTSIRRTVGQWLLEIKTAQPHLGHITQIHPGDFAGHLLEYFKRPTTLAYDPMRGLVMVSMEELKNKLGHPKQSSAAGAPCSLSDSYCGTQTDDKLESRRIICAQPPYEHASQPSDLRKPL